jgi:nucleoside-diphosphate-sugar epimerase
MQALTTRRITVFGGDQVRPNIHIDDMVDLYLFAFERRLAGVYNAAFENLTVLEIAELIARHVPADITIEGDHADVRSYRLCSDRLCATGFRPQKNVAAAIDELAAAYRSGDLVDRPNWRTVAWMKQRNLG